VETFSSSTPISPVNPRTNVFDDSEILEVFAEITNMIHNEDSNNVLIASDLNCYFARNTRFTRTVRNHFQELNLSILWEILDCGIQSVDFTHQFVSENVSSLSTIAPVKYKFAPMFPLKAVLDQNISNRDMFKVHRVTESVVRQGLKLMKGNKSDAIFDSQSDCLIEGLPELVTHLTSMIRIFLSHGKVPDIFLLCTLLPLVKANLGDITMSDKLQGHCYWLSVTEGA
jgi:hypothetical protein